jgi:hypothetical protein
MTTMFATIAHNPKLTTADIHPGDVQGGAVC